MNRFLVVLVTVCSVFAEALSQTPSNHNDQPDRQITAAQADPSKPNSGRISDFIVGPEEVLLINVCHEPDFTVTAKVRSDGKISFHSIRET